MTRVAILSGDLTEAVQYAKRSHMAGVGTPSGPIFVHALKALDGLRDFELHCCGTWYTRADAAEIREYAKFVGSQERGIQ